VEGNPSRNGSGIRLGAVNPSAHSHERNPGRQCSNAPDESISALTGEKNLDLPYLTSLVGILVMRGGSVAQQWGHFVLMAALGAWIVDTFPKLLPTLGCYDVFYTHAVSNRHRRS
jgi:hypothetical protein